MKNILTLFLMFFAFGCSCEVTEDIPSVQITNHDNGDIVYVEIQKGYPSQYARCSVYLSRKHQTACRNAGWRPSKKELEKLNE